MIYDLSKCTVGAFVALALVAGCASKAPVRAAYTGADSVAAISAAMFVGNWSVKVLNPLDGEQGGITDATYNADGSVVMNANTAGQGVDLTLQMTGTWEIQGDVITQTLTSIEETSGAAIGVLLKPFLSVMKNRATGSANVFESSADRLVLVSVEDGQALEYTRLP